MPSTPPCQCCGYHLEKWRDLCPACGFLKEGSQADDHRQNWIDSGMPWQSETVVRPKAWDPINLLGRLALKAAVSRVKGRPPRLRQ